jgi:hypothetical protein
MFSPIRLREFNEAAYRKFIRTLSDKELMALHKNSTGLHFKLLSEER